MKIGRRELQISTPDDLDERLIELTGCSAKEMRSYLDGFCLASTIAAALLPFVKDGPSRHELAETIDKAGLDESRAQVRDLYDRALAPKVVNHAKKEG